MEGKVGIVNELGQLIISGSNPVRQGEYVRLLADRLGVREEAIRGQLGRLRRERPGGRGLPAELPPAPGVGARVLTERELLHLLVVNPAVRESLQGTIFPEAFIEPDHRELAAALLADGEEASEPGRLRERLRSETAVSLLSRLVMAEPHARDPVRAADACVRRIRGIDLEERIDGLMGALRDADRARDLKRIEELQGELQKLQAQKQGVGH